MRSVVQKARSCVTSVHFQPAIKEEFIVCRVGVGCHFNALQRLRQLKKKKKLFSFTNLMKVWGRCLKLGSEGSSQGRSALSCLLLLGSKLPAREILHLDLEPSETAG